MLKILTRHAGRESLAPPVPRCVRFWRIFAPPASCDAPRRCNFATCPRPPNCPAFLPPGAPRAPAVNRGVVLGVPRHALPRPRPRRCDKLRPRYFAPRARRARCPASCLPPGAVMRPAFNQSIKTAAPCPARCFILSPNRRPTGGKSVKINSIKSIACYLASVESNTGSQPAARGRLLIDLQRLTGGSIFLLWHPTGGQPAAYRRSIPQIMLLQITTHLIEYLHTQRII